MGLKILCSGFLVRYPIGGHSWHHLQYLVGLKRTGHEVIYFEDYGWDDSCYEPVTDTMTSNPGYGINFLQNLFAPFGLENSWSYLSEDGTEYGLSRDYLAQFCRECDLYLNLSNMNWIPELELCRRRALVDTDPVFTQIRVHGLGGDFSKYHVLFTYGENVHKPGCEMPTAGFQWIPTRQPVVLDLWTANSANPSASFTTITSWSPLGDCKYKGQIYGQKDREYEPFITFPQDINEPMEIALANAPSEAVRRLTEGGWRIANPLEVTRTPWTYQRYLENSRAEFSVAKHGYVVTRSGWFSDRSSAYLAMGRPVVMQDTGFSDFLQCGQGLLPFRTRDEAIASIQNLNRSYDSHCNTARSIAEEYFESSRILTKLLEQSF